MPRSLIAALFVWTNLVACSSETEGTDGGPCAQRNGGSYLFKYTERSGSCGPGAEAVRNLEGPQPTTVEAPCTGSISYSADNCEVTYETTCPNDGAVQGGELTITGKSKWNADGSRGTAVETWVMRDPAKATLCIGTYDLVATRQ
jgi:hypothetical protein